jgi:hypothetical protein
MSELIRGLLTACKIKEEFMCDENEQCDNAGEAQPAKILRVCKR